LGFLAEGNRVKMFKENPRRTAVLSEERNRLLCETGPGTATGELLRRYRHPAAGAAEFSRQAVKAVRIMGDGRSA
jgi:hypothetical protein